MPGGFQIFLHIRIHWGALKNPNVRPTPHCSRGPSLLCWFTNWLSHSCTQLHLRTRDLAPGLSDLGQKASVGDLAKL